MLLDVGCTCGAGLAAVDAGFGAPFGGEAADGLIGCMVEAEEIADDAAVEKGAVGIGVGQVGGLRTLMLMVLPQSLASTQALFSTSNHGVTPTNTKGTDGTPRPCRTTFIKSRS